MVIFRKLCCLLSGNVWEKADDKGFKTSSVYGTIALEKEWAALRGKPERDLRIVKRTRNNEGRAV